MLALRANPPRSTVEKEIVADVRRFADDAWHDRKPVLRGFSLDSLRESDRTQEARSSHSFRVDSLVTA